MVTAKRPPPLGVLLPGSNSLRPLALPGPFALTPAETVGITGTGSTVITATPADLNQGPHADITNFEVVSLSAGTW